MQVRLKRRYDMFQKKPVSLVLAFACAVTVLSGASSLQARAAAQFDPAFYGAAYPDVVAVFGTDPQALLNHYLAYGVSRPQLPSPGKRWMASQPRFRPLRLLILLPPLCLPVLLPPPGLQRRPSRPSLSSSPFPWISWPTCPACAKA